MRLLPLIFLLVLTDSLSGQNDFDVNQSVKVTAVASLDDITVNWVQDTGTTAYDLYHRPGGFGPWQLLRENLAPQETSYVDEQTETGQLYEYRVDKFTATDVDGFGYVLSGFEKPAIHHTGHLLIVLSSITAAEIAEDLPLFLEVLDNDGWTAKTLLIDANDSAEEVKATMLTARQDFPFTAILLLDDVPIAFSGDINPDAHADHKGAWASDVYYGDLDGNWTDTLVNNATAETPVNHNIPGDGKWDQSFLPSDVEVAVGRVDFRNLPFFSTDRYELLRRYLRKNIAYRTGAFTPQRRAAMRNRNPWTGALGQNGIRNFSPLVGPDSISYDTWEDVFTNSYLWYYGAGGNNVRNGQSWIFNTIDFQAVFTLWFSSYVGDYGLENNFMKASLASGDVLTAGWAGAPHWHMHRMAMGETIGEATILSQNNDTIYTADFFPRGVHVNLLGDPTLKSFVVSPPRDLRVDVLPDHNALSWQDDHIAPGRQYYVYRREHGLDLYELLTEEPTSLLSYSDSSHQADTGYDYLIRAQEFTTTPSGSFFNLSVGTRESITEVTANENARDVLFRVYPNPARSWLRIESEQPVSVLFLRDVNGKTVLHHSTNNQNQLDIILPNLPAGMYFIQVILGNGQIGSRKLMVR